MLFVCNRSQVFLNQGSKGRLVSYLKTQVCSCLFDLIVYVPSTIFQLCRGRSSWVEPVLR